MIGGSAFVGVFDNGSTDRNLVIKQALANGFSIVINEPNLVQPMCILTAKNKRIADEQAGALLRSEGKVTAANQAKHDCGLAHALTPDDSGKVTAMLNRLGNTINIGVHLGLSGYVVVNVDSDEQRAAFLALWRNFSDEDIDLPTVKTPGTKIVEDGEEIWQHKNGAHWWFKVPDGWVLPDWMSKYTTKQGWSILWNQAQALVPPSRKPEGGYELQNAPINLPSWMLQLIQTKAADAQITPMGDVPVVNAGGRSAFSIGAELYRARGWNPFPLVRDGDKYKPFRKGHTGRTGKDLTDEQIRDYATSAYDLGIALRMSKGIIAIDVDGYDDKNGASALFNLEETLGALPDTFRNTARLNDTVSGHRFFTVPDDVQIVDKLPNRNIEILQFHHRYANVWPTKNAKTRNPYRWYDIDGNLTDEGFIPDVTDIPALPPAWVSYLTKKEVKKGESLPPEDLTDYMRDDGRTIAVRSVQRLAQSGAGNRNNQLNTTAFLLGRMVAANILSVDEAEIMVSEACEANGLIYEAPTEVSATFNSGMNAGIDQPWSPDTLEFIDPEPIVVEDLKNDTIDALTAVLAKHRNPALGDISDAFADIVRVCKAQGMSKGQAVTVLYQWGERYDVRPDQVSVDVGRLWDVIDFNVPRLVARDAARPIRKNRFLWTGRIPLGGLTFLAGEGEAGKTTFLAWIVAGVTNGTLNGSLNGNPRHVLYCRPEGSWDEVQTQLMIADADLDYIKEVIIETPEGSEKPPTLPDDIPGFVELCEEYDPALIIFDPLPARMNSKLSTASDSDVRQALEPLAHLAQKKQMAVIGIHHFNKNDDSAAKSRVMGSVAFVNLARSVLLVAYNADTSRRYIGVSKSNVADKTKVSTIEFQIVEDTVDGETEDGWESIPGTRIELVGTDERTIDKIIYDIAAQTRAMRERPARRTAGSDDEDDD